LVQIGAIVFAVTEFADFASLPLEVQRGGVEKDDVECAEEIPAPMKQLFFHDVFGAARQESAIHLVLDLFTQKGHGAVEMMER
jgi:hypothetical protein